MHLSSQPSRVSDQGTDDLYCPACAYNLRGLPDGDCPECGTVFVAKELQALSRRRPRSRFLFLITIVTWPIVYWFAIVPLLALVFFVIFATMSLPSVYRLIVLLIAGMAGLWITYQFTINVARDLAQQQVVHFRQRRPHLESPDVGRLTALFFVIEIGLILVAPLFLVLMASLF